MELHKATSWQSQLLANEWQETGRRFGELLRVNPDLENLIEQVPEQTTDQIFSAAAAWNSAQTQPVEGMYDFYNFNFTGTDHQLTAFGVKAFQNGRITISVSRKV